MGALDCPLRRPRRSSCHIPPTSHPITLHSPSPRGSLVFSQTLPAQSPCICWTFYPDLLPPVPPKLRRWLPRPGPCSDPRFVPQSPQLPGALLSSLSTRHPLEHELCQSRNLDLRSRAPSPGPRTRLRTRQVLNKCLLSEWMTPIPPSSSDAPPLSSHPWLPSWNNGPPHSSGHVPLSIKARFRGLAPRCSDWSFHLLLLPSAWHVTGS